MLKTLICLLFGCNYELVHIGEYEFIFPKNNKPERVIIRGTGMVFQCQRCGRMSVLKGRE